MAPPHTDTSWRLADGVHAAAVENDVVFLSIEADRYQCLPSAAGLLDLDPAGGSLWIHHEALAGALVRAGLIARGTPTPRPAAPPLPAVTLASGPFDLPDGRDLLALARGAVDIALSYRSRPLAALLASAAASRAVRGEPQDRIEAVVAAFHRWAPWAPVTGKCLLRSFMLLRGLHRRGLDATWVFGVRTWPFSAHCWLQVDGVALDEQPDRLAAFTPILAA